MVRIKKRGIENVKANERAEKNKREETRELVRADNPGKIFCQSKNKNKSGHEQCSCVPGLNRRVVCVENQVTRQCNGAAKCHCQLALVLVCAVSLDVSREVKTHALEQEKPSRRACKDTQRDLSRRVQKIHSQQLWRQ